MSAFFNETCKALGNRKVRITSYHPTSNGMVERFRRSLHTGLPHFIEASHSYWDSVVPFYLMAYRTTPNMTTGYSPSFLLHGREMLLPSNDNLKAKVSSRNPDLNRQTENPKAILKSAYKSVKVANSSHQKKYYDHQAKQREFHASDLMYLYQPA